DFGVVYVTGLSDKVHNRNDELRPVLCRALNTRNADLYREYADRMTPVAAIPMGTPQEAIAELDYAVTELGLKAILIAGYVPRPSPRLQEQHPELADELAPYAYRLDNYGIDSDYDYDPFWARCVELGVPPTVHSAAMGWVGRRSPNNYMYNHTGHFA